MRHRRFIAILVDQLLIVGVVRLLGPSAASLALAFAYFLLRDGLFDGQSIGKRLMGLRVVQHPGGARIGWKHSVLRNLLWCIPLVQMLMLVVAAVAVIRDGRARHWGDRLAETAVIPVESATT